MAPTQYFLFFLQQSNINIRGTTQKGDSNQIENAQRALQILIQCLRMPALLQIVCVQENDKNKALFVTKFEHHYCKTTSDGYKYCLQTLFIILQSHKKCKCSAQECFENYCLIITITIYQNLYKELYIIIMELSTMQYDWMDIFYHQI